ncbi:MAG TPA: patatin-like phospholipase family protein [candidate division Zixibacteria bacterium]|nr:patatin-like phospholipase family protein [candidate division Zixibacteria bacterium]
MRDLSWQVKYTLLILLFLLPCLSVSARDVHVTIGGLDGLAADDSLPSYPVVLAISGGGARGLASIGVLKAFEENNIKVAAIAGTSIGGVVGGLYSAGYSADQLITIVRDMDLTSLFSNQPSRSSMFLTQRQDRDRHLVSIRFDGFHPVIPRALTAGQRLTTLFTNLTTSASYRCGGDFDRLPIPFRTVATDIVSGRPVILSHGSLADAMRATLAFPLVFTPLERGSQLLLDGGMVMPVPVDLVRSLCDTVDYAVAINTTSPLLPKNKINNPVDIANQVTSIMSADKLTSALADADCIVTPLPDDITSTDFELRDSLVGLGYQAGLIAVRKIIRDQSERDAARFMIEQVSISGCTATTAAVIEDRFIGRPFTRAELIEELKRTANDYKLFRLDADLTDLYFEDGSAYSLSIKLIPQVAVDEVQFHIEGNSVYPDSILIQRLYGDWDRLTPTVLHHGIEAVETRYRNDGYDLARVISVDIDSCGKDIVLHLDEAIITDITVDNPGRTRDWLIRAGFPLKKGEPYSAHKGALGLANIYGTELFDRVAVDLEPDRAGARVRISVEEHKYFQVRLGWHWDDRFQSEEFAEILDDNVYGAGIEYLIHGRYAEDRQRCFVRLSADRIFSTYLTARFTGFYNRLERNLFDEAGEITDEREENRYGFEASIGQQIARLGIVSAGLVIEQVRCEQESTDEVDEFGLRSIKFESLVENFDQVNFTNSGKRHQFELRLAGEYLGGETEFTKFYSSVEAYWPLGSLLNYHPHIAVGLSRSNLPPSERFYLGGLHSFMGYRTNQLVGDKVLTMAQELRLRLPLKFYFITRYDVGQVYSSTDHIKLSNIRHGFGVIAAFDALIGPIEFGYGVATGEFERYYLNVGLNF